MVFFLILTKHIAQMVSRPWSLKFPCVVSVLW